jgi:simple sugar transport system permease protein
MENVSIARSLERLGGARRFQGAFAHPGSASLIGAAVVFVFFASQSGAFRSVAGISNWLDPASLFGISSVFVALLMIGGEFDLSAGVMTASTGLVAGLIGTRAGLNMWVALLIALVFALAIGLMNGLIVVKTSLPSFIVTLGTFLSLQGLNLGVTKLVTNQVYAGGLDQVSGYASAQKVFASTINVGGGTFPISVVWWIGVTAVGAWVLGRTRLGNWIFSSGGSALASRSVGVPVARTKIFLFLGTALSGWLVGAIEAMRLAAVQATQGVGNELIFIVAAVIGGCLLTGGHGSVIGAALGALIFGMAQQGIVYLNWNSDWFFLFLGVLLLTAALLNHFVRRYAMQART